MSYVISMHFAAPINSPRYWTKSRIARKPRTPSAIRPGIPVEETPLRIPLFGCAVSDQISQVRGAESSSVESPNQTPNEAEDRATARSLFSGNKLIETVTRNQYKSAETTTRTPPPEIFVVESD